MHTGEGLAVVITVGVEIVDVFRREKAVVEGGRIAFGHPANEAAPIDGVLSVQLAVEEAVGQGGSGALAQFADKSAARHVSVVKGTVFYWFVELDVNADATVDDGILTLCPAYKSADILCIRLVGWVFLYDASFHVQVLDGAVLEVAERRAEVIVTLVGNLQVDGVSVAVEASAEFRGIAGADARHHFGDTGGMVFRHCDVVYQLVVPTAVVLGRSDTFVNKCTKPFPVVCSLDEIRVGLRAAAPPLRPCTLHNCAQ